MISTIHPTLDYAGFDRVDVVVEAVVENPKVKKAVLAETEQKVRPDTVLASNTSTIPISELANALERPENFCGMHFFNPVHRMPLVEIIRGEKSSDETIAKVVAWASKMGKTPIVVNDCPGFFVNRVLFPYFAGFSQLLRDGADFRKIDKVMEKQFGWPMGPAYLLDVVGIDTAHHAQAVMAAGFPQRMQKDYRDAIDALFDANRFGQKNGLGFWRYKEDSKGKPKKEEDVVVDDLAGKSEPAEARFQRRRDYRPHDDPDGQRSGPLSGRGHYRHSGRSGYGAGLRPGLPSVPRRRVPLAGHPRQRKIPRYGTAISAPRPAV